jgi:hypothetical protein
MTETWMYVEASHLKGGFRMRDTQGVKFGKNLMKIITILRRLGRLQGKRAAISVEAHAPTSPAGGINT